MNGERALDERIEGRRRRGDRSRPAAARGDRLRNGGPAGRRRRPARSAATSAATRSPPTTGTCSNSTERQILCACEACWPCAQATPELRPDRNAGGVARRHRALRRGLGSFRGPDRPRFLHGSSGESGGVVAFYPSPAGATESELDLEAWRALREANPQLDRPRGGRRGADGQPAGRPAAARDRPDRRVLPAGRAIKLGWEGISGGAGPGRRDELLRRTARAGAA